MVSLRQDKNGNYRARKRLPDDVREEYGSLYAHAIRKRVPQFNGEFFRSRRVLELGREEIGELRQAASYDWRDVEPAIFGTLLEQALDEKERRRLGAWTNFAAPLTLSLNFFRLNAMKFRKHGTPLRQQCLFSRSFSTFRVCDKLRELKQAISGK